MAVQVYTSNYIQSSIGVLAEPGILPLKFLPVPTGTDKIQLCLTLLFKEGRALARGGFAAPLSSLRLDSPEESKEYFSSFTRLESWIFSTTGDDGCSG